MEKKNTGRVCFGVKAPIIREGDDLVKIVVDSVLDSTEIEDGDIIGVTESVVARSMGLYVDVDDIAKELVLKFGYNKDYFILNPIYSRNRFSMILKGIARAAKKVAVIGNEFDEVGNPSGVNPFTGIDIMEYYKEIIESENAEFAGKMMDFDIYNRFLSDNGTNFDDNKSDSVYIYCGLHDYNEFKKKHGGLTLADICSSKSEYGLLGSNKANENTLKLFPSGQKARDFVYFVKYELKKRTGKNVEVMIYGDGCFHSPAIEGIDGSSIWEFADPVTSPAYTDGLNGKPNEIKIKAFADDEFQNLNGEELDNAIKNKIKEKNKNLVGSMDSQGTTPRNIVDLLASTFDLITGSGDQGCPIAVMKNYFSNYAD